MSAGLPVVRLGIIGGGLVGRELASACARWPLALANPKYQPQVVAVCDPEPTARSWFQRVDSLEFSTSRVEEILAQDLDVLYIAVPHDLHEEIYIAAAEAGVDFLGEKPFGIDLEAARRIVSAIEKAGVFARCSSEFPYYPGARLAYLTVTSGRLGQIIEARSSFLHSSDLDPHKKIGWKRVAERCGPGGAMADLGIHTTHLPLRLGWHPSRVAAVLQDIVTHRPDNSGAMQRCDTLDNATLMCSVGGETDQFPLIIETKRIVPGEMNTWVFTVTGTEGGVAFSTRSPAIVRRFRVAEDKLQAWEEVQAGSQSYTPTITGPIFEFGFPDAFLQMLAAYLAERDGTLGDVLGCVTPDEAVASHHLFAAALAYADESPGRLTVE